MATYAIRSLAQTDEPFLWEMLYHALYVPAGQEPFPKEIMQQPELAKYVAEWGRAADEGYMAIEAVTQAAVGAVWMRLFSEENQGYGYVAADIPELSIAVLPEHRQQGLGSQLLAHLIQQTRGRYRGLSLSVSAENPAVRLYKRLGFEPLEQTDSSLTMVKILS